MFKKIQRYSFSSLAILTAFCVLTQFTVLAKTGTVVKNTGVRHTICTSLSSQAKAYYSTNGASYSAVSKLKGGNDNCLTTVNSALFDELHDLMDETMTNTVKYNDLPTYWAKTDANNSGSTYWYFYSDQLGKGTSGKELNREHVWCKSNASFDEKNGGADPHHLRPAVPGVNQSRGDKIFGNVKGVTSNYTVYPKTGKAALYHFNNRVEINDNIKGDVARVLLYVYCRWEEPNLFMETENPVIGPSDSQNKGGRVIETLETLLQWCEIDPVDTWEMSRNDQCENLVGNRNVFIDYPEYAWLLFGKSVPKTMTTPSGEAKKGDSGNNQGGNTSSNTSTNTSSNTSSSNNSKPNTSTTTSTNTISGNTKPTISNNTSTNTSINTSQNQTNGNTTNSSTESGVGGIDNKPQNEGKPFDPSLLSGSSTGSEYDDSMTGIDDIFERIYSLNLWVKIAIFVCVVGTAVAVVIIVRNIKIKRKDD